MRKGKYPFIAGMLVVPLAFYVIFMLSPYIQAIYISFTNWSGYTATKEWVGLANYDKLIHDPIFWTSLKHVVVALVVVTVCTIALALFFATMLNVGGRKGQAAIQGVRGTAIYKVVYFFPYVLSIAVVGVLFTFIYDPTDTGLLNGFLGVFGVGPINWLGDQTTAYGSILAVMIWVSVGFYVVLFTAAMGSIPREIYESVALDGANRWTTFWRITLPLMWDTLQVGVIYLGIQALDMFTLVNTMSGAGGAGGPNNSTQVITNYLYLSAFSYGDFGYASALGVALLIITLIMAAVTFRLTRRERVEY